MLSSVLEQRLLNQGLLDSKSKNLADVVRSLGAVQAQEYAHAKWALRLRVAKAVREKDVEDALNEGKILRTHVMRPTWHYVAPEDLVWMQMLTGPRVNQAMAYYNRNLDLTEKVFEKSNRLIQKALEGENFLTRQELKTILHKNGFQTTVQKLAHIVARAETDALICNGPRKGKQHTYALVEERVKKSKKLSREEALEELVSRYFTSHGPATIQDFVWWSGLRVGETKKGIELAKLKSETIDGLTYWFSKHHLKVPDISNTFFLLPVYDEYTISYKNTRFWFHPENVPVPKWWPPFHFSHAMISEGKIVGMWRRENASKHIHIQTKLFRTLTIDEKKSLNEQVKEYEAFYGLPVKVN